jgi:hypothetical protein
VEPDLLMSSVFFAASPARPALMIAFLFLLVVLVVLVVQMFLALFILSSFLSKSLFVECCGTFCALQCLFVQRSQGFFLDK